MRIEKRPQTAASLVKCGLKEDIPGKYGGMTRPWKKGSVAFL
jgi:hypothetical protein